MASGNNKVEIKVEASVSGQADLEKLEGNLKGIAPQAQKTAQAGQAAGQGMGAMGAGAAKADGNISASRRGLVSISTQLKETQKHVTDLGAALVSGISAREFVQAAADMEKMRAGLVAVTGSAESASKEMEFVQRAATRAGVDVAAAAQAYLGLSAATKGTAVEGQATRDVFEAVTLSMAKAGKSSAETQNALVALSQIASKGTVSMEELRGQLGEALPGALQAAANGLGVTTQDLIKLVENGQVAAQDLFPALTKGLGELYGSAPQAQTLSQEITNIKNAFLQMSDTIGQAGGLDALKNGAEIAQTAITFLGESLTVVGQEIGVLSAAVVNLDFSQLKQSFADIEQASRERLLKAAEHNTILAATLKKTGDEAINAALAVQQSGQATEKAAGQSASAATSVLALGAAYAKTREGLEQSIVLAGKELEAAKAQGEASIAKARALGDEVKLREAQAAAVRAEAQAADELAMRRETELGVLRAERDARQALLDQESKANPQREKEIQDLDQLIAKKEQEANKTRAQADALLYKAKANSEEAVAAESARSTIQNALTLRKAEAAAALEVAQSQKVVADSLVKLAELSGDDTQIRKARIKAIEAEIAITKAKAEVMRVEAQGSIDVAKATLEELRIRGELTKQKEAELNATIKVSEAKIKMAQATGQSTQAQEHLVNALRNGAAVTGSNTVGINSDTQSRLSNAGAIDGQTAALTRQAQVQGQLNALRDHYSGPGENPKAPKAGDGKDDYDPGYGSPYSNPGQAPRNGLGETKGEYDRRQSLKGQNAVDNTLSFKIRDKLNAGTLESSDLADVKNVIAALKQNDEINKFGRSTGGISLAGIEDDNRWKNLIPLLEQFVSKQGSASSASAAKTYNVNIKLGGSTTAIATATDADAQKLIALLQSSKLSAGL